MVKIAEIDGTGKEIKTYLNQIISEMDDTKNYSLMFKLVDPNIDRCE